MSIAHSAATGVLFTMGAQVTKILLQFASVAILARLLSPHDYGLIALVLVVVGAGEVFRDFGLTAATIQAESVSSAQRSQLFWLNTLIGVVIAVALFGLSWPISWLATQPELLAIIQVMSILFVLNGLMTQHRAQLQRQLRFKAIAIIDIASAACGLAAAVIAAFAGAGYWALVLQQLTVGLVGVLLAFAAGCWWPGRPRRGIEVRHFIRFGWNLVATNMVMYAANQVDTLLVNAKFGTSSLGLYNRAFQLVMTPLNQVRGPLNGVAQPVYARVQHDRERFDRYVAAGQLALGYVIGIPLAMIVALAEPLVRVMLGEAWMEAAPILRCFAIAAFLSNLSMVGYWVYVSRGLVAQLFRYTLVSLSIKVTCIVVGAQFGLVGVAIGFAVAPAISWPISLFWLSRITSVPVRALYLGALRVAAVGVFAAGAAWGAMMASSSLAPLLTLLVGAFAGLVIVGAIALLVPWYRLDAAQLLWFGKLMVGKRGTAQASPSQVAHG